MDDTFALWQWQVISPHFFNLFSNTVMAHTMVKVKELPSLKFYLHQFCLTPHSWDENMSSEARSLAHQVILDKLHQLMFFLNLLFTTVHNVLFVHYDSPLDFTVSSKIMFSFQPNKLGQSYIEWDIKTLIMVWVKEIPP